jgi:hypothetical protein
MMDDSSDESLDHSTFETSDPVSETNEEKEVTIHSVRFQDDNVTHNNVRFQDDLAVMGSKPAGRPSRMEDPIATPTETDEEDNERLAQERANALQGMERLQRQMAQYLGRIKPDHDHTAADSCDNDDDKNVAIVDFVPTPTFKKELAKKRSRSRSKSRSFSSKGMKEKTQPSSVEEDNEELAQELQNALKDMARLQNQMTQYLDRFKAGMKLPQIFMPALKQMQMMRSSSARLLSIVATTNGHQPVTAIMSISRFLQQSTTLKFKVAMEQQHLPTWGPGIHALSWLISRKTKIQGSFCKSAFS